MPTPISVQLYTLREQAKTDFPNVLRKVAEFGYVGVELAGLHGHEPEEIKALLDELGLVASSSGGRPTEDNFPEIVKQARLFGYKHIMTGCGRDTFQDKARCIEAAKDLNNWSHKFANEGLELVYHNHEWEFQEKIDGKTGYEFLMENAPALKGEVDTYWVAVGGEDPAGLITRYADRIPMLHIKDGPINRQEAMTAVGAGKMEWEPVFKAAEAADIAWLVVELDECDTDMFDAVRDSVQFLADKGWGKKR